MPYGLDRVIHSRLSAQFPGSFENVICTLKPSMQRLKKLARSKLTTFLTWLLITSLIVACQSNVARQVSNSQLTDHCRTVQHALGQVCVPRTPLRLISLDDVTVADVVALGVSPVGFSISSGVTLEYLAEYSDQISPVGTSEQPNLEEILKLNPDLIIGIEVVGEPIFEQLSQIAPTALGKWNGYPSWREHFDFVAYVLNKEDEARQIWDRYEQSIDEIQTALGNQLQDVKVSLIYAWGGGFTIDAENSFAGSILADIGLQRPTHHAVTERGTIGLSIESLPDIDADFLFVSVYNNEGSEQTLAEWQQNEMWNQLKAVQNRKVYIVDASIWRGGNPIAANLVIDDLFKYLVNNADLKSQ